MLVFVIATWHILIILQEIVAMHQAMIRCEGCKQLHEWLHCEMPAVLFTVQHFHKVLILSGQLAQKSSK